MKNIRKLLCIGLALVILIISPVSSFASASELKLSTERSNKETYELYGKSYNIYSKVLVDGSVEKTVVNPDNTIESYVLRENVLYDSSRNKIATFNEESEGNYSRDNVFNIPQDYVIQATSESATSPYPISAYTKYIGMTSGNVVLHTSILAISTGALTIIVGIIAPPIGVAYSVMLIAAGVARGINSYAIFYKKWQYHHKIYGSLEKMWETQWYWNPGFSEKAGTLKRYYSHFY